MSSSAGYNSPLVSGLVLADGFTKNMPRACMASSTFAIDPNTLSLLRERYLSSEGGLYGLIYGRCSRRDATSVEKTRRLRSFGYD